MRLSQSVSDETETRNSRSFDDMVGRDKQSKSHSAGADYSQMRSANFSNGGLMTPDGQSNDPFPPSLAAYFEVIRSIAEYLREQGMISGDEQSTAEAALAPKEEADVDEPTTFAIGEEEHSGCADTGQIPAIGEAIAS